MFLYELFEEAEDGMIAQLRQHVMDHVLPMVSHGVESVPIQDIQDKLTNLKTGLTIDRAIVQQVLDPTQIKMIKKIEGDLVYFENAPQADTPTASEQEQERQTQHMQKRASQEAVDKVKNKIEHNVEKRVQDKLRKGKK